MFLFVRITFGVFLLFLGSFLMFSVIYPPWRRKIRDMLIKHWKSSSLLFINCRIFFKETYYSSLNFRNVVISYIVFWTGLIGIVFIVLAYLSFTSLLY